MMRLGVVTPQKYIKINRCLNKQSMYTIRILINAILAVKNTFELMSWWEGGGGGRREEEMEEVEENPNFKLT